MKRFIIINLICLSSVCFSQENWTTSIEMNFGFADKLEYEYEYDTYKTRAVGLETSGFLLSSYELQAHKGYFILDNFSVGAVGGFNYQSKLKYSMLRLGIRVQLHFANRENAFTFFQLSNNFSMDNNKFKNGPHARYGLGFPISRKDGYLLSLNLFGELSNYYLEGSKPLLNEVVGETPYLLREKSTFGISLGITF